MSNTTAKIRTFHALLANTGLRHQEEAMLAGYGAESTKELTAAQLDELIEGLRRMQDSKENAPLSTRRLRSKVLDVLTEMGIMQAGAQDKWARVNAFLQSEKVGGKLLYQMTEDEMKALISKLYAIKRKWDERAKQEQAWAASN